MSTPRVLIFRSELLPASETFIAAQAGALQRYQPVFAGLRRSRYGLPLAPLLLPRLHLPGGALLAPTLARAARAQAAALVHAHFALDAAEALPLRRALKLPLVVTLHGYDVMRADAAHAKTRRGRTYLRRRAQLWSEAALFVCVSEAIRQRALERGFPAAKLRVLPIGVDTQAFAYGQSLTGEARVLFVGRLVAKKGCEILIQAMEQVQRKLPNAQLLMAGDGPERLRLQALAARCTHGTRFLGAQSREEVQRLMASARCLAAPSVTAADGDAEGLPIVLCEALALGLPVASTVHSGVPELVQHGQSGLLSTEGDVDGLARHLLALCMDDGLTERLRAAGRMRVEQAFNLQRQTEMLEEIYDEVSGRSSVYLPVSGWVSALAAAGESDASPACAEAVPAGLPAADKTSVPRLRTQAAWLLSGNGAAVLFQAIYFLLIGRMLGSAEYGALVGTVALVNVCSQFSSLGMEMVLLRTVARDRAAFAATWARALAVSGCGFAVLFVAVLLYGWLFLTPALRVLLPYLACSDALFGKITQLGSRALQGADLPRWSAQLAALTNGARALTAALLAMWAGGLLGPVLHHVSAVEWVRLYCMVSLLVSMASLMLVTRLLGRPRWSGLTRAHLAEGLSFSFSSSAISVYNDVDKTLLLSYGMAAAAGVYGAAYRVIDVVSTPIVSLFAAASPRLFRQGAEHGARGAAEGAARLLRWSVPFALLAAPLLALGAPALPRLFGHSFAGSTSALRFLCLLPLFRGLHYAYGTAITACTSQWPRTAAQAGAALLNLALNLLLIPRWGWRGAAVASLLTDGALAVATFLVVQSLVAGQRRGTGYPSPIAADAVHS